MALAEGLHPLYFRATTAAAFFGRRFAGTNFHPFSGALAFTSVANVLWELSTIFGSARLGANDQGRHVTVHAIGDALTWAPYHSHDDLLWLELPTDDGADDRPPAPVPAARPTSAAPADVSAAHGPQPPRVPADRRRGGTATQTAVRYKYSVEGLIRLVDRLDTHRELALGNVMELLGVRTPSGLKDYRRFLQSGQAIILGDNTWTAAPSLSILAIALRNVDIPGVRATLREFPSYAALAQAIEQQAIGVPIEPEVFGRAAATLTAWAELTGLGAHVHGTGFFATPTVPNDAAFAEVATTAFEGVRGDGRWVATGRWLEQLIVRDGIHPNITRLRIQTASAAA